MPPISSCQGKGQQWSKSSAELIELLTCYMRSGYKAEAVCLPLLNCGGKENAVEEMGDRVRIFEVTVSLICGWEDVT